MMIALYAANWDCVIESHVEGVATCTVNPKALACCASVLEEPPFTDVDKIRTDPDSDALAGADATIAPTAVTVAAPASTPTAGVKVDTTSACIAASAPVRPARMPTRRAVNRTDLALEARARLRRAKSLDERDQDMTSPYG
jgi:hypothetical protein